MNAPRLPATRSGSEPGRDLARPGVFEPAAGLRGGDIGSAALEPMLAQIESHLDGLGQALRLRDPNAIDLHATQLHRALVRALEGFSMTARHTPIPHALRARLAHAGAQVAVQRECLARATAALDRAIAALLPRAPAAGGALYGATGKTSVDSGSPGVRV